MADEACEEALLDSTAPRRFVGIDLGRERVPDGTTLLKFRRLLEKHELGAALFTQVNQTLLDRGLKIGTGTIVDATIIGAPSSTKNVKLRRLIQRCLQRLQVGDPGFAVVRDSADGPGGRVPFPPWTGTSYRRARVLVAGVRGCLLVPRRRSLRAASPDRLACAFAGHGLGRGKSGVE